MLEQYNSLGLTYAKLPQFLEFISVSYPCNFAHVFTLLGGTIPPLPACVFSIHPLRPSSRIPLWLPHSLHSTSSPRFKQLVLKNWLLFSQILGVDLVSPRASEKFDQSWCVSRINYAVVKPLIWSKILGCSNASYVTFTLCNGQEDLAVSRDSEAMPGTAAPLSPFHCGHHTSQPRHRSWAKVGTQHRYAVSRGEDPESPSPISPVRFSDPLAETHLGCPESHFPTLR